MRLRSARRAQAEIIGTLILIASSALMTTLLLFWGLSLQGQSNTNFGSAIARTNAAAAEQISIDTVQFFHTPCGSTAHCSAMIYVRNFGDQPVKLSGIDIQVLASGVGGAHCEVTTINSATTPAVPLTIVARSVLPVNLTTGSVYTGTVTSWSSPSLTVSYSGSPPTAGALAGYAVQMTSGTASGSFAVVSTNVVSNGVYTITLTSSGWSGRTPSNGDSFSVKPALGGWCASATNFPTSWAGQTISVQVSTSAGTQYSQNFAVPA